MRYLGAHWTFDPMIVLVVATVALHEVGLHRLAAHSQAARTRRRRLRSYLFYGGLAVLVIAIASPIDYWASEYFYIHMIEHVLLAFALPVLIVAGAPWVPMLFCLPVGPRRRLGRFLYLDPRARGLRSAGRFLRQPTVALVLFNAAMIVWHVPAAFTFAERNAWAHIWLMHASFIVTGILFWLQIIPSHPLRPARSALWQAGAILSTNVVMTVLAISMSFLTAVSWYPTYAHLPGVTLSPFADQQIGAAILWVCGDFWAYPALYIVIRRAIESEGSFGGVVDKMIHRRAERDALYTR
jgi:putative membrane protein